MALDSFQKRMSAMNPACPWRGPLVDATEAGFNVGNRRAGAFMTSLVTIAAAGAMGAWLRRRRRM